jgi:hypothetical protein
MPDWRFRKPNRQLAFTLFDSRTYSYPETIYLSNGCLTVETVGCAAVLPDPFVVFETLKLRFLYYRLKIVDVSLSKWGHLVSHQPTPNK